ncbi:LysR family transcriptional regulator [Histidinibacterium lentulum]|uniref:LysR family transcriptional regulator n=1 Tax=Histidinibacterium lentulum TaxID=2480588 RepID=A0A3N2R5V8_9RHOB|nr:LysR family transcriptional regulator [Histidinibacterium lentulum]ROU02783.1 LysR family transcriptional regulator [Histidinibacterium lentulum]
MAYIDRLDWSLLQTFLAVAETGSLTAAAARLGLSQPTVGRHVQAAETALGTPLFRRHARGLALTETGADLLAPARQMQEAASRIALAAAGREERLSGVVRITASDVTALHHLPPLVARLRREEPEIEVEILPSDDSRNLLYGEADIAVRMYRPRQLDLVTRHLGDVPIGLYAATAYLDRAGRPRTTEEALRLDFVGHDRSRLLVDGFAHAGVTVTRDWFPVRCDDNAVYWELVRAGAGAGFAQRPVGDADPGVERIETGLDLPVLPIWLTAHEAIRSTPRIRRTWDLLAEGLRPLCRALPPLDPP